MIAATYTQDRGYQVRDVPLPEIALNDPTMKVVIRQE